MSALLDELLKCLDLQTVSATNFLGYSLGKERPRVFGGLVVAHALVAASRTVEAWAPHSLHGYFILPGDVNLPILYEVENLRDGRSFATRRCNAIQNGKAIFSLIASFQKAEPGLEHEMPMPEVAAPEALLTKSEILARFQELLPEDLRLWLETDRQPVEIRFVDPGRLVDHKLRSPAQNVWLRITGKLPDDPAVHRACLAYMSDLTLLDTALVAHGLTAFETGFQIVSLDHALWFHRPFRADEWLLFAHDSPNMSGGRGLTRALIYSADGRLVASASQEGLIRTGR